jgi:adenosylcobinamide-GDP ribazoletransferase
MVSGQVNHGGSETPDSSLSPGHLVVLSPSHPVIGKRSGLVRRLWGCVRREAAGLLVALQFLTVLPPLLRRPCTEAELGRAVGYFPLVGLLLGLGLLGLDYLLGMIWPPLVMAVLLLAAWVMATGALHLDGFLDTCDGLLGGRTPDDRLRIMRDERVGAFAVIGGVLLVLLQYAALVSLARREAALLLAPTLARWGMAVAIVGFPYGRAEGLGRAMKDNTGWSRAILAGLLAAAVAWGIGGRLGLLAFALVLVFTLVAGRLVLRRLPGLTGDIYGALCVLLEALVLLVVLAGERT